MAQLDVQPKRKSHMVKIIGILVMIAILFSLYKGCYETTPNASIPNQDSAR